jgi:hypothetical protein
MDKHLESPKQRRFEQQNGLILARKTQIETLLMVC